MTTIAYKAGVMACDSAWTCGGTVDTLTTKIERLSSGALLGMAGQNDGRALSALLDKVKTPAQLPDYETIMNLRASLMALLVLPKGKIYKIETTVVSPENWSEDSPDGTFGLWEITGPIAAVGSGGDLALAVMEAGKGAKDAVRIACKYDINSRLPIHTMTLKP
jgi:ATP-dependent protease HslVU (ClpYQ) peptidase subunit